MVIALFLIVLVGAAAIFFLITRRNQSVRVQGTSEAQPLAPATPSSLAEDLSALADLRDKGILSHEEFNAEKARLLGLPS